jgi:hypothetical protein
MPRRWGIDPQAAFNEKSGYSTPIGGEDDHRGKAKRRDREWGGSENRLPRGQPGILHQSRTPEQRSEIVKLTANARWKRD